MAANVIKVFIAAPNYCQPFTIAADERCPTPATNEYAESQRAMYEQGREMAQVIYHNMASGVLDAFERELARLRRGPLGNGS